MKKKNAIALTLISIVLMLFTCNATTETRKCLESHKETKTRAGYTTFVMSGKVMIPIYHPSTTYQVDVCDKYEEIQPTP